MTRLCAWCKTDLGGTNLDNEAGITHGICAVCSAEFLRQAGLVPDDAAADPPRREPGRQPVR